MRPNQVAVASTPPKNPTKHKKKKRSVTLRASIDQATSVKCKKSESSRCVIVFVCDEDVFVLRGINYSRRYTRTVLGGLDFPRVSALASASGRKNWINRGIAALDKHLPQSGRRTQRCRRHQTTANRGIFVCLCVCVRVDLKIINSPALMELGRRLFVFCFFFFFLKNGLGILALVPVNGGCYPSDK